MSRRLRRALIALGILFASALGLGLCFALSALPALPVAPQQDHTLSCVTLIRPGRERIACATIRISKGRIAAIEKGTSSGGGPPYVLPGLVDAHVHSPLFPADRALYDTLYLLHGITTVRNLGDGGQSLKLKPRYERGELAGPRLLTCGVHLDGPGGAFIARTVKGPKQGARVVAELAQEGVECIKVLSGIDEETLLALRAAATRAGLPLIGHLPSALPIERAPLDEIEHLTGVPPAPSPGFDDASWQRWYREWDAVDAARLDHVAAAARRQGQAHAPTLSGPAHAAYAEDPEAAMRPRPDLLPAWHGALWDRLHLKRSAAERAQARRNLPKYMEATLRLARAGVVIVAGSDTFQLIPYVAPGAGLIDELRLLVRAGLSPEEALAAAALPVRARGTPPIGTIEVSGPADLIVLDRDPTLSIDNLDSPRTVMVDGRRYEREALLAHLERQLAATRRFPYALSAWVLEWIFRLVLRIG